MVPAKCTRIATGFIGNYLLVLGLSRRTIKSTLLAAYVRRGLLVAHPRVQGVLFDLPNFVTGAAPLLEASAAAGRCEIVAGDFFKGVPSGADAYLLKKVIHDWDDARAVAILGNCRKTMAPTGKLLIIECVMPERAEQGQAAEAYLLDLEMLVHTPGGRERTASEFNSVLEITGFRVTRIVPTSAPVSVIEARPL